MSKQQHPEATRQEEFREIIRETFSPWMKSRQSIDAGSDVSDKPDRHNDGERIYQAFHLESLANYLVRAAKMDHPLAKYPRALPHFLTHIQKWEKWELGEDEPDFGRIPRNRQALFDWYAGKDAGAESREDARERRMKQLRPGGTGIILHGEQGTTKTTAMYWLVANLMQANQHENVIWQSTLDDTEWQIFAPWATLCLPEGVEIAFTANPHSREYRDLSAFEIAPDDVAREVIRYEDPESLLETMADRTSGHLYVVYPDPHFRHCQSLTGWSYETMWQVDESDEATDLDHFWFALMEGIRQSAVYNEWTTLIGDEAHKWLRQGASDEQHHWHKKIQDWATYWGDARKKRLSCILAVHEWGEVHHFVRNKVRWGGTMNGEYFPKEAPIDGKNDFDQGLGDLVVWNKHNWNFVGFPDIKRNYSVPADIEAKYPGLDAVKQQKS